MKRTELSKPDFDIIEHALGNHEKTFRIAASAVGVKTEAGISLLVQANQVNALRNKFFQAHTGWLEFEE